MPITREEFEKGKLKCWRCGGASIIILPGPLHHIVECPVCRGTGVLPVETNLTTKTDPGD